VQALTIPTSVPTTTIAATAATISATAATVPTLAIAAASTIATLATVATPATAVTATATATAVATPAAGTAAAAGTSPGVGEVDLDAATIELLVIKLIDGLAGMIFSGIRYEAKATRAACFAIAHHDRVEDLTVTTEEITKGFIGRRPVNGANEERGKESKHETSKRIDYAEQDGRK